MIDTVMMICSAFGASFSTWFFTRRRQASEVTGIEIANAKEVIDLYKDFNAQIRESYEEAKEVLEQQQKVINHYQSQCVQINKCRLS